MGMETLNSWAVWVRLRDFHSTSYGLARVDAMHALGKPVTKRI